MEFYGISGKANKIIPPYFNNRYQSVLLKNNSMKYFSKWEPIKYEVSQGSIHRPYFFSCTLMFFQILYLMYPNQFYLSDDTSITITNSDPSEFKKDINNIFIKINNWFKSNLSPPNFDKTHFLQLIAKIVRKMRCK